MSKIPVVYFSKSYSSDRSQAILARDYIRSLNCTIKEYSGGTYDSYEIAKLKNADYMVIVPPKISSDRESRIGKGQYTQIITFIQAHRDDWLGRILIVTDLSSGLYVRELTGKPRVVTDVRTQNWQDNYGILTLKSEVIDIINYGMHPRDNEYHMIGVTLEKLKKSVKSSDVVEEIKASPKSEAPILALVKVLNIKI